MPFYKDSKSGNVYNPSADAYFHKDANTTYSKALTYDKYKTYTKNPLATTDDLTVVGESIHQQYKKFFECKNTGYFIHDSYRMVVGGDPEFFAVTPERGFMVPAYSLLEVSPQDKRVVINSSFDSKPVLINRPFMRIQHEGFGIFYQDGYQFELGYSPATCMAYGCDNFRQGLKNLHNFLKSKNYRIGTHTAKQLTKNTINKYGMVALGCRPSLNAYNEDNRIEEEQPLLRFTGGHFHFGFSDLDNFVSRDNRIPTYSSEDTEQLSIIKSHASLMNAEHSWIEKHIHPLVQYLDQTVGLISLAICGELEHPKRRQMKYGRAGDYRLTATTLEYRVPSNAAWFHPVLWHIFGMIGRIMCHPNRQQYRGIIDELYSKQINANKVRQIINDTDYKAARELLLANQNFITFITGMMTGYLYLYDNQIRNIEATNRYVKDPDAIKQASKLKDLIEKGLAAVYGTDLVHNWQLEGYWKTHSENNHACYMKS